MNSHVRRGARKPIVVRIGNTSVKVYQGKSRGYNLFTVVHYANGSRKREAFGQLEAAKERAEEVARRTENGERDVLSLTNTDRDNYVHAMNLLRPLGVPLHAAIEEYVAARQHLDGAALLPTLKEHALRRRTVIQKTVREIVDEILAEKKDDGLSPRHLQTLRSHLNRFANSFRVPIGSVTAGLIQSWIKALAVGPRTRNNARTSIVTLFNFARSRNYLPKGQPTEIEDVSVAKDNGGDIGILTPIQMADLMAAAAGTSALCFALGGFAGLRRAEIERLEWSDFNFARGHITVAKDKAKTAQRRLVPIRPNLAEWLRPYHGAAGKILKSRRDSDAAIAFAKEQGIDPWPDNALRHSWVTYRLAAIGDPPRVAHEGGTSVKKLNTNYRELADEHDAAAWFSIVPPPAAANIVDIAAA